MGSEIPGKLQLTPQWVVRYPFPEAAHQGGSRLCYRLLIAFGYILK